MPNVHTTHLISFNVAFACELLDTRLDTVIRNPFLNVSKAETRHMYHIQLSGFNWYIVRISRGFAAFGRLFKESSASPTGKKMTMV